MSEEQAFLEQLSANPGDDVTRQVYADWLEERGDERGAYLRAELELAALPASDVRYADLDRQVSDHSARFPPEWIEAAGRRWDVWLLGYPPQQKISMIKTLRELTGCGLADGKAIVESLPAPVGIRVSRHSAETIRSKFEAGYPPVPGEVRVAFRPWSVESESLVHQPASYYQLLISGARPRRKTAAIQALVDVFSWPHASARSVLEASTPQTMGRYATEEDARQVLARLEDTMHVDIQRVDPPPVPRVPPLRPGTLLGTGPFTVRLTHYDPSKKINVIRTIRELLCLGLAEAKAYSERPFPIILRENVVQAEAEAFARRFAEFGPVEIVPSTSAG